MRTIFTLGVSLGLILIAPVAKADCVCFETSSGQMTCFTVLPGPHCSGDNGSGSGGGGGGKNHEVLPYDPTQGGGGAGGNLSESPRLQLNNFKKHMQELQTPMIGDDLK